MTTPTPQRNSPADPIDPANPVRPGPTPASDLPPAHGFFVLDPADRFTFVSREAARVLDREPGTLRGKSFSEVMPEAARLELLTRLGGGRRQGSPFEYEERVGDRWFEVVVYPTESETSVYFHDVTEQRRTERQESRRSRIRQALAEVSSYFVTAAEPDLDRVLAVIGGAVDASRSYIFRLRDDGRRMDNTHEWCAEGVTPEIENLQDLDADLFPWWLSVLRRGETLAVEDVSRMAEEAVAERGILESQGIRSVLVVPIMTREGTLEGFLGFDDTRRTRSWMATDAQVLKVVAEMIGGELERRQTMAALRQTEERFRQLADNIPEVFWMTSVDKNAMIYVSRAYETIWGRSCDSLLEDPRQWLEAVHPDDRDRVAAALPTQVEGTYDEEYRVIRPDGGIRWIRDRAFPVRNDQGVAYRVAGLAEDVTDRRRQGEEVQLLASAIAHAGEGVIITDADGAIQYVNPAFEEITGYSRTEVLGENPRILKSGRHDEAFYREMWDTLLAGEAWHARFTNMRKDGTLYTQDSVVTPVHSEGGAITHMVGVFRDVTNELALEEQLRQSQKMEAVGRLAGGIAHDFNNVLTVITGRAEFAQDDLPSDSPLRADLQEIITAAQRAHNLSRQLLAFSRQQHARPRVLDPARILRDAENMLRRLLGEDLDLRLALPEEPGRVRIDPTQLDQVLFNLAVNARDAMPRGGRLTVEVAHANLDGTGLHGFTEAVRPGRYVRLAVSDTGVGMDAETRERIFEPFYSTKPLGEGSGLGLSTVYGIIKQADGYIRVESEKDRGTTFEIYLPRTDEQSEDPTDPEPAGPGATRDLTGSETVLVVEDQTGVRSMVRRSLERVGYRVLEADNGAAALAFFENEAVPIDLVLTDVVMPEMGGPDLAERLRELQSDVRVLYMSGYAEHEVTRRGALEHPRRGPLLEKPFGPHELQRKVREALDLPGGVGDAL